MPKLKGADLSVRGTTAQRTVAGDDEIVVGCPLRHPCGWTTIRPLHAAYSAQVAHGIRHARGMA